MVIASFLAAALALTSVSADTNGEWITSCTVPRTAHAKVLIPHSVGRVTSPDWTKLAPGAVYERCNPGWGMTYRMVAVLNETGDSYALIQKGAREHFSFLRVRQGHKDGEVILESGYVPDADDLNSGKVGHPFETRLVPFRGGWFAAAQKYREVVADEPWLKAARARDFGKLRNVGFWFWNRLDSETVIPPIERFMKDSGVPAALDWYWWHKISYDTAYPNYWPPREPLAKFAAAVKRLNEKGVFCQTYMNGMCWDADDPSWTEGGVQGVRRRKNGTFSSTPWNRFTNHRLADMCGEAPEFQRRIRTLVKKMRELGFDGQYLDCIGNGGYGACWASNHVHAAGGGAHMVRDFRRYVTDVLRENPGMALCTEDVNESYLDLFTSYIITSTSYERFEAGKAVDYEQVPVFPAVYHGAAVFFGNFATLGGVPAWDPQWPDAERWTEEKDWPKMFPDQFPVEVARGVVWGLQPTAHNFRMENVSDPSCADGYRFMLDTARFYHAHRDWLFDGEMRDPGELASARAEVRFLNRGTYTKKGEYSVSTHVLPTVFHSVWKSPKGEIGAVLVNWSDVPQAYALKTPDLSASGRLSPRSWKFVRADGADLPPLAGDGVTDDTDALQARLDSGAQRIVLPKPAKEYLISKTLVIGSDTELVLEPGTRIRLAKDSNCPLIRNRNPSAGDRNITITGGIWDSDNLNQFPSPWCLGYVGKSFAVTKTLPAKRPGPDYKGWAMYFEKTDGFSLRNVTIRNPTTFGCCLVRVTHFDVDGITFDYETYNPVRACLDGIHLDGGCRYGRIANLSGACWDDTVALNSNDDHGGPTVSEGEPITDIVIDGIRAEGSHSGVRLLSTGGDVRNITIRNVHGTFYRYGVGLTHFFRWDPSKPRGRFDNITIEDCTFGKCPTPPHFPGQNAPTPMISVEEKLDVGTLVIRNVTRREEVRPEDPTIRIEPKAVIGKLVVSGCRQENRTDRPMTFLKNEGIVRNLVTNGVEEVCR